MHGTTTGRLWQVPLLLGGLFAAAATMAGEPAGVPLLMAAETSREKALHEEATERPDYVAPDTAAKEVAHDPALAARRHAMIEACEENHGVDCARQADAELGAERLEGR